MTSENLDFSDQPSQALIKAELLSHGIALSDRFIENYGLPFLEKRRAYGNSDPEIYKNITVPQELYLLPSGLVCSVNVRPSSEWLLDFNQGAYFLKGPNESHIEVTFPKRPAFYDLSLASGEKANSIATLYGGGALGIFIYGTCALVENNVACKYCSIKPNRLSQTEFLPVITPQQVYDIVKLALSTDDRQLTQVMINGGNFKDSDKSFSYYIQVCSAAKKAIDELGAEVELHLIAYPPKDHTLFEELATTGASLAMNVEVYSQEKFKYYCPGKDQQQIISALKTASKVLGQGKVFSIFVGGLESVDTMQEGFDDLAAAGVTPVINVFHPDPGTDLENYQPPSIDTIMAMGKLLQETYKNNDFMRPFYMGCGRNSIDTESFLKLF